MSFMLKLGVVRKNLRTLALGATMLAGFGALMAPGAANAAATTNTGPTAVFQAPFLVAGSTTGAAFSYSMNARFSFTVTAGTAADSDPLELIACLLDSSNTYQGFARGAAAQGGGSATKTLTVAMPSQSGGGNYTQAIFIALPRGQDNNGTPANSADDTFGGINPNRAVLVMPNTTLSTRAGANFTIVDAGAGNTFGTAGNAGATSAQIDTLCGLTTPAINVAGNRIAIGSSYSGPTLLNAAKDAATPTHIRLGFSAALTALGDNTDISSKVLARASGTSNGVVTTNTSTAPGTNTDPTVGRIYVDNNSGAFTAAIDDIRILTGSNAPFDEAGNPAVPGTVSVTTFARPAYASTNTTALVTASAVSAMNVRNLWTTAGVQGSGTVTFSVRFADPVATANFDAADDYAVTPAAAFVAGAPAGAATSGNNLTFNLTTKTTANDKYRFNRSNGRLQYTSDNGTTWTDVTIQIRNGASSLQTLDGQSLNADLTAQNVVASIVPTVAAANVSTRDSTSSGKIDGVVVDYGAPLGTTFSGYQIRTRNGSTPILTSTFTLDPNDDTRLRGVITNPSQADWNGNGTANESADNTIYSDANFNTGVTGATVQYQYQFASASGTATYLFAYNASTGANLAVSSVGPLNVATDGAPPVVTSVSYLPEEGTSPAAGRLRLVTSEGITYTQADFNPLNIILGGSPLSLLNLNDNVTALVAANDVALTQTTVANDTITLGRTGSGTGKVTGTVAGRALTLATATAGFRDGANNVLATDGTKTVSTGTSTFAAPVIQQATANRSGTGTQGNINQVVLRFTKPVALASGSTVQDGMFKVSAVFGGTAITTIAIPSANVDTSNFGTNYVTLTIPSPGIPAGTLTDLAVSYDVIGTNKLVSTDSTAVDVDNTDAGTAALTAAGGTFNGGINNTDNRRVSYPNIGNRLYSMEITGRLTTDGTAAVARGTIVRAHIVSFENTVSVPRVNVVIPSLGNNARSISDASDFSGTGGAIGNARRQGQSTARLFIVVNRAASIPSGGQVQIFATAPANATNSEVYEISVDVNSGAISGPGGLSGTVTLQNTRNFILLGTATQTITGTDGLFRLSVASDNQPNSDAFVLVGAKQPADASFRQITSAVQRFRNFVPFRADVSVARGTIGGALGTVNLANFQNVDIGTSTNWQLVGFRGNLDFATSGNFTSTPVTMERLLIGLNSAGEPASGWTSNSVNTDEAFALQGGTSRSAFEISATTQVDNLQSIAAGYGLALRLGGNQRSLTTVGTINPNNTLGGASTTADNDFSTTVKHRITYPVTAAATPNGTLPAGWSIVTADGALTLGTGSSIPSSITAIIQAGGGQQTQSWFRTSTDSTVNTLSAIEAGRTYFVYSNASVAFSFFR